MAITTYLKDGQTLYKVYVNVRSKECPSIRAQKVVLEIESENAAIQVEKRLIKELTVKVGKLVGLGLTWREIIERWQAAMRTDGAYYRYEPNTILDHGATLRKWTAPWLDRIASELGKADGRELMRWMEEEGKAISWRRNVKNTINVVYKWGIEERLIRSVTLSPVEGLKITGVKNEKVPDILTIDEIRKLLYEAKRFDHPWYSIWSMALLTGMRSGELHALLWTDVDFDGRRITVSKTYHTRIKAVKGTKAGYWRTVPISDELFKLLQELKLKTGKDKHVLPRFWEWDKGEQARVLRAFCQGIGIRSVCFHALRACFATQLLANDIAPARVMKICGWRDLKTMQYYIRLAGIDEAGATQVLKVLPSDMDVMAEVVNLFDFKAHRPKKPDES